MPRPYSQFKALAAVTKGSFKAMLRSPSAVAFTIGFPLVFVLVFGFLEGGHEVLRVGVEPGAVFPQEILDELEENSSITLVNGESEEELRSDLQRGRIVSILSIEEVQSPEKSIPQYVFRLETTENNEQVVNLLKAVLHDVIRKVDDHLLPERETVAHIETFRSPDKIYRPIDFILPGMLGFSLLSTGVFGTAFLFFSLRQTLVLKRFFATPIKKFNILLGEALARVVFQLIGALFLIAIGVYFYKFHVVHGWDTILELLLVSAFGLIIFMGFGFIISSMAKNTSTIPAVSNIIVLPQFMLAGTFFPIDVLPEWLQPLCRILPLTYLNDALRKMSFDGFHIWQLPKEMLALLLWGVLIYAVATKVFKWE